jgi:hypothetical protein
MMAIFRDAKPDDPMYSEGPQSYNPHWARAFLPMPLKPPKPFAPGDRIRLIGTGEDEPNPTPLGSAGKVRDAATFDGRQELVVDWDSGEQTALIVPPDVVIKLL